MGMAAILVIRPGQFEHILFPSPLEALYDFGQMAQSNGLVAIEMFEIVEV